MRALILVRARRGRAESVGRRLEKISGVTKAVPVFGAFDVVARADAQDLRDLARIVRQVARKWGVVASETLPEWVVS